MHPTGAKTIDDNPSKSARKREYHALQALGERLIGLPETVLAFLPLNDDLREAVRSAKRMTSRGALRRQRQLIGKLMARSDAEAIREALDSSARSERADKAVFHDAETWRDRIVREGRPALDAFAATIGSADEEIEALVRQLGGSRSDTERRRLARRIFRGVHARLTAEMRKTRR